MNKNILLIIAVFICSSALAQTVKRPFKPTDFYHIPTLDDPQLSPDGKWIAYSLAEVDSAKDKRISHIWMQSYEVSYRIIKTVRVYFKYLLYQST